MSKRETLLQTAASIITSQGVQDFTLDAVAKQAEVSKGGLLYHFPTKEALIYAMIEHFVQQFEALIEAEMETTGRPGRWLRAYVTVCTAIYEDVHALSRVLIALSASNPHFAVPVQEAYDRWRQQGEVDGVLPDVARLVCMAADGGWLYSLHLRGSDEEAKAYLLALRAQLLALVDGSVQGTV